MGQDRLIVESGRRILRDWLEAKGIEVDNTVPKKTSSRQGGERLAFKLEVQVPASVLSELKSELHFGYAVSDTQKGIEKWQSEHPAATVEEISDCRNHFISWGAENYQVDKEKLMLAILGTIGPNEADKGDTQTATTDQPMEMTAGVSRL